MDTFSLDAEMFINEIANHPALWDLNCRDNKCTASKEKAWNNVARTFITSFDGMSKTKKLEVLRKIQSKWRNLRDNYVRSTRRRSEGQRAYTYAKNLAFLDPVYANRAPRKDLNSIESNNESQSNDESDPIHDPALSSYFNIAHKKRRAEKSAINIKEESTSDDEPSVIENFKRRRREKSLEFLEVKNEGEMEGPWSSSQQPDEDKLFFDSLLPVVHKFDLDQKLEFRTKILQLITTIRSNSQGLNVNV